MNAISWHWVAACISIVALVVLNVFGHETETIDNILSGVIGAAAWGAYQRQQKSIAETNERVSDN